MSHIIKRLQIEKLFGTTNIDWELNPNVNVLVGQNGLGKSTILGIIKSTLNHEPSPEVELCRVARIKFANNEVCEFDSNSNILKFIDIKLIEELMSKIDMQLPEKNAAEEARELLEALRKYKEIEFKIPNNIESPKFPSFKYSKDCEDIKIEFISTINMSANSINSLTTSSGQHTTVLDMEIEREIQRLLEFNDYILKEKLLSSLNTLFSETEKTIEFSKNKLAVKLANGDTIPFSKLSSGERQVIFIFLKVVIASVDSALILMDEPEISLHLSWQEKLLNEIRKVNATSQIIIVTHSPAMLMNGWMDSFVDIANIMTDVSSPVT